VASGPYGAVAAGGRGVAAVGAGGNAAAYGTRFIGTSNLQGQGLAVRNNFGYYNTFQGDWYRRYPGAWYATGLAAGAYWATPTWGYMYGTMGYPADVAPIAYNYGDNVTYQDGNVYYGGEDQGTQAEYADQASQIATTGTQAAAPPEDNWKPLGVFAMAKPGETTSDDIFQLAMNDDGVVRGNYYNARTDHTLPVQGGLDKATQRVAWTVGGKEWPVCESGLYNLTQEQSSMLVHLDKDRTQQYLLVRVPPQEQGDAGSQAGQ